MRLKGSKSRYLGSMFELEYFLRALSGASLSLHVVMNEFTFLELGRMFLDSRALGKYR